MREKAAWFLGLIVVVIATSTWLTGTRGGLTYFCPQTLEIRHQSEFAVLNGSIPIYRSPFETSSNELIDWLVAQKFVEPQTTQEPHWELISHWNFAWKDGHSTLYYVLYRNHHQIMEWSVAHPKCAKLYWSEGFRLLRSSNDQKRQLGSAILREGWYENTVEGLQQKISAFRKEIVGSD